MTADDPVKLGCRQRGSAGRQCDRRELCRRRAGIEATGATARACSHRNACWTACQSEYATYGVCDPGCNGGGVRCSPRACAYRRSTHSAIFADEGGLVTYGVDVGESYRGAGAYIDRILRGATPAELPVQAPTKYELVINLKTAKTLGLTIPLIMQMTADEAIE